FVYTPARVLRAQVFNDAVDRLRDAIHARVLIEIDLIDELGSNLKMPGVDARRLSQLSGQAIVVLEEVALASGVPAEPRARLDRLLEPGQDRRKARREVVVDDDELGLIRL